MRNSFKRSWLKNPLGLYPIKKSGDPETPQIPSQAITQLLSASQLTRRITLPVVALFVLGLAGIVVMTMLAAKSRDEDARDASRRTAAWAVEAAKARLADLTLDYAQSDESFAFLREGVDEAWANTNIGGALYRIYQIEHVYVFDRRDRLVFAFHGEQPVAGEASPDVDEQEDLAALLSAARAAGATDAARASAAFPLELHGEVHLAAAALIQPQEPGTAVRPDDASVLVFLRDFSPRLLSRLGGGETLPLLRVSTQADAQPGELMLPLIRDNTARIVGYLIWRPQLPGSELLRAAAAPIAGTGLLMLALLALVLNRARRAGLALDEAVAELSRARAILEQEVEVRTAELREAEARYRSIIENAVEGIFQFTPAGRFINANPAMARILGYDSPEHLLADASADTILPGPTRAAFDRVMAAFGKVADFVSEVVRPDGTKTWISQNARAVLAHDGSPAYYEGMAVDITARREAEETLIKNAFHDALTGLPNRFLFFERLSQVVAAARRERGAAFAVLFLDCDRFKLINDSFGHLAGDGLLISLSRRLSQHLRPGDMLARLGGDEFAVLVECEGVPESALRLAERLHEACRQPMAIESQDLFLGVSIGIALARGGVYRDAHAVLRDADIAMYRAKDQGGSRTVLFEPGMHQAVVSRLAVETELRHALERGEFVVYYQPIVSLTETRIVGFEALVRWSHPSRGLVPPGDFIPTAEETGMIVPIGEHVLEEACSFAASWRRRHGARASGLFMSVNVAAAQLDHHDAEGRIARILARTGLPGESLKLEITESAMMSNPLEVHRRLIEIGKLGVQLCVDDFGTGYSSLSHLHTFPVGTLKIDRAFTNRLMAGREHAELVRTILLLGENLGMTVIAEGVETSMQRDWLRAAGCPFGQGFYFGVPVDYRTATTMLAEDFLASAACG